MIKKIYLLCFILAMLCSCSGNEPVNTKKTVETEQVPGEVLKGEKAELIDKHLSQLAAEKNFSGGVFILRNDTILLCKGYGFANKSQGIYFHPYTLASMGSITKNFTAAAILKLYQDGKLKLNDKLETFFEKVPADKKNITIHQLLTHSSGFHEFSENDGGDFEKLEKEEFIKRAFKEPLAFKPGTKAVYTNVGMSILGVIIEKISGKDYENFVKELFPPGDKITLGYHYPNYDSAKLAVGYKGHDRWGTLHERYVTSGGGPYWNLKANGGLHASLYDIIAWSNHLSNGSLLADSLVELMFTPHVEEDGSGGLFHFGYGCNISKSKRGTKLISNGGSNGIYFANLIRLPEEGLVFYLVTNNSEMNSNKILPEVTQLYFEGHISQNSQANLNSFETRGAELVYTTMMEKGPGYFTENIFKDLQEAGLSTSDDMFFLEAGQRLIAQNKLEEAQALYELYVKAFPQIIVAWNDLGEIYMKRGNKAEAKKCFEEALKLKPDNERAKRMLEQLAN